MIEYRTQEEEAAVEFRRLKCLGAVLVSLFFAGLAVVMAIKGGK